MRICILIICFIISFCYACSSDRYECKCTDEEGNEVAVYKLNTTDKSTAGFECGQKALTFGSGDLKDITCTVHISEND